MTAFPDEVFDPVFDELDALIAAGRGDAPRTRYPGWERDYPYGAAQERVHSEGAVSLAMRQPVGREGGR